MLNYDCQIDIDRSVDEVAAVLKDPFLSAHWMKGLKSMELVNGRHMAAGALYELKFRFETVQQLLIHKRPDYNQYQYHSPLVVNHVEEKLEAISKFCTRLIVKNQFRFKGIAWLFSWAMPRSTFEKQTKQHLLRLKGYIEENA